jgi:hypothetical protein
MMSPGAGKEREGLTCAYRSPLMRMLRDIVSLSFALSPSPR